MVFYVLKFHIKSFDSVLNEGIVGISAISKCKSSLNEELVSVCEMEEEWGVSGSPNTKKFLFSGEIEPCDQKQRTWRVATSATMTAEIPGTSFGTTQTYCTLSNPSPRYMITMILHEHYGVSNHQPLDYLFNTLYRSTPQKHQSSALPALCDGIPLVDSPHKGLTHWGRVTHICVVKLTIIGSDNGLSPGRRQAIIWTNDGILLIGPLGTNFIEILIGIQTFSFKKMHLKMSSAKWRPFCLGLNVLMISI